ncbi:hypothetical protein [Microbispora sp. KK1-11]|uniref:hypothetical protein n=1 Tax=Microbispora sp. KK1-11 TaxID=2053005 RepID=UPI00115A5780|nr:hypothetical protein [Microbispora sp. KK1-11]TQS29338.1 hypothetical protein FLW16_10040 [Microbispora sp. KK1-11]
MAVENDVEGSADRGRIAVIERAAGPEVATGRPSLLGGMFLQAIVWWLDTGRQIPAREIATHTAGLASALIAKAGNNGA